MKDFKYYLDKIGEIGYVAEVLPSIVYVNGLPEVHPHEVVIFDNGDLGEVISISKDLAEVLVLARSMVKVGDKVARTGELLQVPVGDGLLGRAVDSLGRSIDDLGEVKNVSPQYIDIEPQGIMTRDEVTNLLDTGVTLVDLVVPLAKGQRQLIIGDRKTGKSQFLLQTILTQASQGMICIYALIGLRYFEIRKLQQFFKDKGIQKNTIIIASGSSDPSGLIYLTPYTAMTAAEHFRDKGKDVLLILDDLTSHARCYREITLLAKRFPGRSSYPGDIFYLHARLVERAGKYTKGSITCLPVAESVLGDLSGYIQTNLMAMTDGHVFFDIDLYNQGKRPSVNPFLSVTRVGHQAQTPLQKDLSRDVSSFLVNYEKMKQFLHFGAEVGENLKKTLALGEKVDVFFNQDSEDVIPITVSIFLMAGLWSGFWNTTEVENMKREMEVIKLAYSTNTAYAKTINDLISSQSTFESLVDRLKQDSTLLKPNTQTQSK